MSILLVNTVSAYKKKINFIRYGYSYAPVAVNPHPGVTWGINPRVKPNGNNIPHTRDKFSVCLQNNQFYHSFIGSRISFRYFLLRCEMMGGSLKISPVSVAVDCLSFHFEFRIHVSFSLCNAEWMMNALQKAVSFVLGGFVSFCASDIFLSENLIYEKCFSTILAE